MQKIVTLSDPSLFTDRCLVDGKWIAAENGAAIEVANPATGEILGGVPNSGRKETDEAIAAATHAFGPWSRRTTADRAALLERWHDLVLQSVEDLALLMTLEQGKPLGESRAEVSYGASFIKWFAEEARRVHGELIPAPSANGRILVQKQPIGVVAAITPWNFPNAMGSPARRRPLSPPVAPW